MPDNAELDKWVKQAKEAIDNIAHLATAREAHVKELEAKIISMPSEETVKKQLMEKLNKIL